MTASRVLRRAAGWAGLALLAAMLLAGALTWPPALPSPGEVRARWKPSEAWLYDRNGQLIDSIRADFEARRMAWVPLKEMAPAIPELLVASEDRRFPQHGGVDWLALASSLKARLTGGQRRGASTISMQLAAFLAPELSEPGRRGWLHKARQLRAAQALEEDWSKDEILEAYLNLARFRGEAQGIGAAARALFGKPPSMLTRAESALVVAILPSPGARPERVTLRACALLRERDCGALKAQASAMTAESRALALDPGLAPHLAARLLDKPGMRVKSTLDASIQRMARQALEQQLFLLGGQRARDGAVIVADNRTGEVLAYVGGAGRESTAAYVDGANAYRQAGSTLKPFLYGLALEKGWLTPASILDDSPVQLDTASGLYVPQNYDRGFKGPVSVRTALAGSLNIPAVRTLLLTGPDAFRDRLWDMGYHGLAQDGQHYGYSLALGSAEVTLIEQAAAYRALALGGRWAPLRLTASDAIARERSVMPPEAAWLVGDILADPVARSVTFGLGSALKLPFWAAAKTGTSKAMRDNWCIGYSSRYTVAVWIGNLEGDSMKAVSGTSGAAPVWRTIMLALHRDAPPPAPVRPAGIEQRLVQFDNGIEAPRDEYFLSGTGQTRLASVPETAHRPRIASPVSGSVFAQDPDIPAGRQLLSVTLQGPVAGHRLLLDKRPIGDAESPPAVPAIRGAHRLALVDISGRTVDQVLFTVR